MGTNEWMVRCVDGTALPLLKSEFDSRRHLTIPYDDAVLIGQLPSEVKRRLCVRNETGQGWVLSPTGKEILSMDNQARQVFETRAPESKEILEERKARLTELAKGDPNPLAFALRELCFRPDSWDPRFRGQQNLEYLMGNDRERVERDAREGRLRVRYESGIPIVLIMDLVRYLADIPPKLYPRRDFHWTHAYRRIIEEKWQPGDRTSEKKASAKGGRPALPGKERALAAEIVKVHRKDGLSFDACVERFHLRLESILREKWKRGPGHIFEHEELKEFVKRLWDTGRKRKSE